MTSGSLIRSLVELDLWPIPSPENYRHNVRHLQTTIEGMTVFAIRKHSACFGRAMKYKVADVMDTIYRRSPVQSEHLLHMKIQSGKISGQSTEICAEKSLSRSIRKSTGKSTGN